jgi:hypothetical protein
VALFVKNYRHMKDDNFCVYVQKQRKLVVTVTNPDPLLLECFLVDSNFALFSDRLLISK